MEDSRLGLILENRYRIEERLAAGGTGVVYRATHLALNRSVAIKFLHQSAADSVSHRGRFMREAEAMSRLTHPNLATITDFGSHEDRPYLVMELYRGRSLRELLASGPLPVRRALGIARQILLGLASAHEAGVVHRDLKPGNVFVIDAQGEDHVKILDFGVAKLVSGDTPTEVSVAVGRPLGTPQYMSPEQAKAEPIDTRSDLYSVGVVLYEMVTGERPFDAGVGFAVLRKQVEDQPRRPGELAEISDELENAILRSMEKNPDSRFPSASEMAACLAGVPELQPASVRRSRGRRAAWLLAVLLVVAGAEGLAMDRGWVARPDWLPRWLGGGETVAIASPSKPAGKTRQRAGSGEASPPRAAGAVRWAPPRAVVELASTSVPPVLTNTGLEGVLAGEPFAPPFARVDAGKRGVSILFSTVEPPAGDPCGPITGGDAERSLVLTIPELPGEGETLTDDAAAAVSSVVGTAHSAIESHWTVELVRLDGDIGVAAGRIRLRGPEVGLSGSFHALYCPDPREDTTAPPVVNGIEWNPDLDPDADELPIQAAAGAFGTDVFRPSYANLVAAGEPGTWVLSFFAETPPHSCTPLGPGDRGVAVVLPARESRAPLAYRSRRAGPVSAPSDARERADARVRADIQWPAAPSSIPREQADVVSVRLDVPAPPEVRGRIYVLATDHRRSLFTGAFRAVDCR